MTPEQFNSSRIYSQLYYGASGLSTDIDLFAGNLTLFLRAKMWLSGWYVDRLNATVTAPSLEEFIKRDTPNGLGKSVEDIHALLQGPALVNNTAQEALKLLDDALFEEGRPSSQDLFSAAVIQHRVEKPLAAHGEVGNGRSRDYNVMSTQGNKAEYLTRRLARDYPDIAKRLADGEFKSVRAAAKAAGIVRDLTPLELFARLWAKASTDERQLIREFIDSPVFDR